MSRYVIWSNEHKAWWRPNRLGYTNVLKEAGLYSQEDAQDITADATIHWTRGRPNELPIRVADLPLDARVLLGLE